MPDGTIILAVVSDLHVCSTIGLCPPRFALDDGGEYVSSPAQRWLWRNWLDYCQQVHDRVAEKNARLIVVLNGDLVEGNHHHTLQVITENKATQQRMAYTVLKHLIDPAVEVYVVRGTPAHVGRSASLEEAVADDLINAVHDGDRASWWLLPLDINGTIFDFAHHGRLGRLPWTQANAVNSIAGQVIIQYAETGDRPPNVVIRSHLHRYADTGDNFQTIRVISTPAWQLATAFVHRIAPGAIADIGGLIFTCKPQGKYSMELIRYRPKRQRPIKVEAWKE